MSKKHSDLQMPDYSPLIAAAQKSADASYALAKEQFEWAKKTYAENKVIGDKVTNFAMGQMEKMAGWADADRKRYENIYQPLEDQAAARAQDYASPERQEYEAGRAEAQVADKYRAARDAAQDRLEAFGVDPSQLRSGALDLGTRVAEASAQVGAGNAARTQTEMYGDQLMANAIATGKGYPGQALAAAGGAGSSGNQAVNTGLATTASGAQTMGTAPTWQGLGNQGLGQWGQFLNAQWQSQLQKQQADQQASSGIGSALGAGMEILSMIPGNPIHFAEGGGIPDDPTMLGTGTPVPMEASPSAGAIPDDVTAQVDDGSQIQVNAGEFVIPKDVVGWLGEKGMQQFILKARKEMGDPNQAPAQPEQGPPPGQQQPGPPIPSRGVGAIPEMETMQ